MNSKFTNSVVMITGAANGIGRSAATYFSSQGARVAIADTDQDSGKAVAEEILNAGYDGRFYVTDVSDEASVEQTVAEIRSDFGPIHVLINNAAIARRKLWLDITEDDWDSVIGVNLKGCFLASRAVFHHMKELGRGKIINVSSIVTELGTHDNLLHYISSKSGIIGFTRALARCVGHDGIQVNCVMPGAIQTEQTMRAHPDQDALRERLFERQCVKRLGEPEDIVRAFEFLASDASDFVSGTVLCVDGGWAMY